MNGYRENLQERLGLWFVKHNFISHIPNSPYNNATLMFTKSFLAIPLNKLPKRFIVLEGGDKCAK
jgi:hypothetical protein